MLVVLLMIVGSAGFSVHLRQAAIEDAESNTVGVARLLDETLTRTLGTTDMLLRRMAEIARAHHHGRISAEQQRTELGDLQASLPERGSIVVIDAQGNTVAAQVPSTLGTTVNLSDRPWFKAHAEGTELVVAPMVFARYSNNLIFTVSRRVSDDQGNFIGVVACGIHAIYFTNFYNSLVLGQDGVIAAASTEGLILRQPNPELYVGRSVQSGPIFEAAVNKPAGTVIGPSLSDGIDRISAYRRLKDYDIVVVAGMALDEVLAPWWSTVGALLIALFLAGTAVAGLAVMAFRGIGREQAILAGLEQRVQERTEEAEHRAEEARLANESKTRFLAAASHDLRQPLQAAGMFAEVLSSRITDPSTATVVDKLRRSIEATNSLLGSLLDVSALEAGKITPNLSTFRLMPLLAALVDQIEPEATSRGLSIGAVPTEARIVSDPVLLERLLRNLLVNAVRYTETGGILIGCRHRGDHVAIQVWDTGIGIPASKVAKVFDDFTRIDRPGTTADSRGLGLGLGVVRRMAGLLDHPLEVRTLTGRGSCFGVLVPRG
ncbi:Putative two-component sensor histidine-kinase, classical system [Magnetospirillum molischianum DSM 120]|uniref:histidine kinase n=2 Tax=Magnetospirillum molischianum TaxID=1083 RepID=H8FNZ5_MAGML|nr:Putative two-component sensor histidine-kinase, classical system [Magnetospirillum molischianum DSM 120]